MTRTHAPITPTTHFPRRESDCPKCSGLRPLMPPEHKGRGLAEGGPPARVVPAPEPVAERETGPGEECAGNRDFHGPVGKDVLEQDAHGDGDHHTHGESR